MKSATAASELQQIWSRFPSTQKLSVFSESRLEVTSIMNEVLCESKTCSKVAVCAYRTVSVT